MAVAAWSLVTLSVPACRAQHTMDDRFLPVLLLLLGVSGSCGQGEEPGGPPEVLSEESIGEEVPEEDGILVLNNQTLSLALQEHSALMVEFCKCLGQWAGNHGGSIGVQASTSWMWPFSWAPCLLSPRISERMPGLEVVMLRRVAGGPEGEVLV